MNKKALAANNGSDVTRGGHNNLQDLIKQANDAGILTISAYGGMSEAVLKDAIKGVKSLNSYLAAHPDK
jgi:hypothetical protein